MKPRHGRHVVAGGDRIATTAVAEPLFVPCGLVWTNQLRTSAGQGVHSLLHAVEHVILADERGQPQHGETLLGAN